MDRLKIKEPNLKNKLKSNSNGVYSLKYHLIIDIKYRRKIFENVHISNRCKDIIKQTMEENGADVINMECGEDHIHILFETKPTTSLTKIINVVKGRSSRLLRKEFSQYLSDKLWGNSFWSPSYYLASTGNVSLDTLINYVNNQRNGM